MKTPYFLISVLCSSALILPGCGFPELENILCSILPDSDHCFQNAGMQTGEVAECEKIAGTKFKGTGSNPPRDKCVMNVAANTYNYDLCKQCKGGLMSYTPEDCYLEVAEKNVDPSGCKMLSGALKQKCFGDVGSKIHVDDVLGVDQQIDELKKVLKDAPDKGLEAQLKGLETKRQDLVDVLSPDKKKEYASASDPTRKLIYADYATGLLNEEAKNQMVALNDQLQKEGKKMTDAQYEAVRNYMTKASDPKNDIENMSDREIVTKGVLDKVGGAVEALKFWKTNDTTEEKGQDLQLRFYAKMLERQAEINRGISPLRGKLESAFDTASNAASNAVGDKVQDTVLETVAGSTGGKLIGVSTAVLKEALDVTQETAKKMEFRGLVNAYNQGIKEEMAHGVDLNTAHAAVTKNLQEDPYRYATGDSFAKYGNLIENKDCDGSNPHCINRDVFFKAMKKSYSYRNS